MDDNNLPVKDFSTTIGLVLAVRKTKAFYVLDRIEYFCKHQTEHPILKLGIHNLNKDMVNCHDFITVKYDWRRKYAFEILDTLNRELSSHNLGEEQIKTRLNGFQVGQVERIIQLATKAIIRDKDNTPYSLEELKELAEQIVRGTTI